MRSGKGVAGTYRFRASICYIVVDPDGKRWAFFDNGEQVNAAEVRAEGQRLSDNVPKWVLEKARDARKSWDAHNEKMDRWLARDQAAMQEGRLRPLSELPVPNCVGQSPDYDPKKN